MKKIAMLSGLIIMSMSVFGADRPTNVRRVTEERVFAQESKELIQAINKDDVEKVRQIISRHTDISKMVEFFTLIRQAKKTGASDEELKEINERYQNDIPDDIKSLVNTPYGSYTPLVFAIEKGDIEIVKLLIDCGADVNAIIRYSVAPLTCAIKKGDFEIIKLLVDHWANVNKVDNGRTPIHQAIFWTNNLEVVKYLVDHGADINARDKFGETPLHEAVSRNNLEVVKYLLDHGANINDQSQDGYTPLLTAANYNNAEIAKYLLERGAVIDVKNDEGETALMRAVKEVYDVDVDLVKCLIDHGANIYAEDNNGNTPYSIVSKRIEKRDYSRGGKEKLLLPILELNSDVDEQSIQAQMERGKKVADRAKRRAANQKNYDDSVESASRLLRTGNITPPKKKKKPNRKLDY